MRGIFNKLLHLLIIGITNFLFAQSGSKEPVSSKVLQRIAFGSCVSQNKPQPIWETIVNKSPELFIFIGDNIYCDSADMDVMRLNIINYQLYQDTGNYLKRPKCFQPGTIMIMV